MNNDYNNLAYVLGDGMLNKGEVDNVIRMCVSESNLHLHEELVEELSNIIWGNITDWTTDHITFAEFYRILRHYPAVYDNLDVKYVEHFFHNYCLTKRIAASNNL